MRKTFLKILGGILRVLSRATLEKYKPNIIGITGNVGKTSTREAVKAVLSADRSVRSPSKNFNNEIGLPLAILGNWQHTPGNVIDHVFFWPAVVLTALFRLIVRDKKYPEILVLEYGIDRPGDMNRLLRIARPNIGIVTAVGVLPVHVEFFNGPEGVAKEKEKLVSALPATGFALLNADDEAVLEMKRRTNSHVLTYGMSESADLGISNFENRFDAGKGGVTFKLNYGGNFIPVKLPDVFGRTQVYAASVAAATGLILGMNLVKISEALQNYVSPPGRLKVLEGIKGSVLIDDTYNAAPLSMDEALQTLKRLKSSRKIAVLGDMLELGRYTMDAHQAVGTIAAKFVELLVTVGIRGKFIAEAALREGMKKNSVFSFNNLGEAAEFLRGKIHSGDLVLFKASQGVRLEKVVYELLAEKGKAGELLVRQGKAWQEREGLYG